ncbi:MAG: metallophosphoesterase, partial [Pirellulaceae bacterium]
FLFFLTAAITGPNHVPRFLRVQVFAFFIIIEMSKIPGIAFLLIDDIIRLFRFAGSFVFSTPENNFSPTRLTFINRLALGIAAIPLGSLLYGMINGAYKYTIRKVKLPLQNLPDAFQGLRIVQVSDIHCGSFADDKALRKAFAMVQELNPDVVFFTGDLVNNAS